MIITFLSSVKIVVVQLLTRNMLINRNSFFRAMEAEPLPDEKKNKWRREMDWLLSPTNYMVQLVPAKQCMPDGRTIEIMTQKAREDVHLNLPALQKLDAMLLETLNSMMEMEFSYDEGGSRVEGRSKRWWLPTPQVSVSGLSDGQRKKLLTKPNWFFRIFKPRNRLMRLSSLKCRYQKPSMTCFLR
ncbi:putative PRONE domain, Rop guanine nucleotide exchange factor [Helianthus annuus]|uniref:PRONE domain, Rop guanine nucleotide exchange factor n=1 Tax=Helianthus annuus TaxID=4232 RepID=A0A251U9Y7_HELAN|nr:putative PRONE domain, Rop guanine nucleotide exchange factor [Helianthus annuus]KAJ0540216.1 putative PRONE domain, Rop guanine nucleotide exchange factor [Helianthus annuus]KAJ0548690.1 putative PRONE domain, Rop guanine nucleotide exchange factor [Helianthus annuus]KAJ0554960.1 putative PRONE domain, Rop guanine nucleotide exchange factor [Helianthus annuus]KAJ0720528.1 putative PRONE domain, Rop guanine nucleotide exchange factor [Helianthus annuus]